MTALFNEVIRLRFSRENQEAKELRREKAEARLAAIDKIATKLYNDNGKGWLDDHRLDRMIDELERESGKRKTFAK